MAPTTFSGALMSKKKSELQQISAALELSEQGTRDELAGRIKKHLDRNPDLEDNPSFAGLYVNRRKRSIQPQSLIPVSRLAPTETAKPSSSGRPPSRRVVARESTPEDDDRPATFDHSPDESTPPSSPTRIAADVVTPNNLPPLPPSPAKSHSKTLTTFISKPSDMEAFSARLKEKENEIIQNSVEMLERVRNFLSNSRNIWSLTAVVELFYLLWLIIPWRTMPIHLANSVSPITVEIYYPPLSIFQTDTFWLTLLHWALPTLVIPAVTGNLISFLPATSNTGAPSPFDPLTAAIMRLAAQVAWPFAAFEGRVHGLDVLGIQFRVFNAAVGLAFAFAEAISTTPNAVAKALATVRQSRLLDNHPSPDSASASGSSRRRRALVSRAAEHDVR